jgi:hypothetical protein
MVPVTRPISCCLALLFAPATAMGQDCTPLDEHTQTQLASRAIEAATATDSEGVVAVLDAYRDHLRCQEEPVLPGPTAQLLAATAVLRMRQGHSWQSTLQAAFAIDPTVADLLPDDVTQAYKPTEVPLAQPVDEGVSAWLDGVAVDAVPEWVDGMHIFQVYTGTGWRSRLFYDEPLPMNWLRVPKKSGNKTTRALVEVGGGLGVARQSADPAVDWLPKRSVLGGGTLLGAGFEQHISGVFRVWADGEAMMRVGDGGGFLAAAGVGLGSPTLSARFGGGVITADAIVHGSRRKLALGHPRAGMVLWTRIVDVEAWGGGLPGIGTTAGGHVGFAVGQGKGRWRMSSAVHTVNVLRTIDNTDVTASRWAVSLRMGARLGG